jgi:hypothetical protein
VNIFPKSLYVAASIIAAALAQDSLAGIETEQHTVEHAEIGAVYDQNYSGIMQLPLFDTLGGMRELVSIDYQYSLATEYFWTFNANPTQSWAYSITTLTNQFQTTVNGLQFLPTPNHPGNPNIPVEAESHFPVQQDPGNPEFGFPFGGDLTLFGEETDAAFLTSLIGTGTIDVLSEFVALAPIVRDLDAFNLAYPDSPPLGIVEGALFDETISTFELTGLTARIQISYNYITVPEPSALSMLAIAGVIVVRRR